MDGDTHPAAGITSADITNWDSDAVLSESQVEGYITNADGVGSFEVNASTAAYIDFNGGDATVEWRLQGHDANESFVILEPEDGNKIHFEIIDTGSIKLHPDGNLALEAHTNGNVTVTGDLSATDVSASGNVTATGDLTVNDITASGAVNVGGVLDTTGGSIVISDEASDDWAFEIGGTENLVLTEPEDSNKVYLQVTDGGAMYFQAGGTTGNITTVATTVQISTDGSLAVGGDLSTDGDATVTGNATVTGDLTVNDITATGSISTTGYNYGDRYVFHAEASAQVSPASPNWTVTFTEVYDKGGIFTDSSDTVVAPRTGYYSFSSTVSFEDGDGATDDTTFLQFSKNNSTSDVYGKNSFNPMRWTTSAEENAWSISAVIHVTAGDNIRVLMTNVTTVPQYNAVERSFSGFYLGD